MQNSKMRIVVMGCGGSGGVPYAGNVWLNCDPNNPKNYRTRPSIYLEYQGTRIVVDTGPEFRMQINKIGLTDDQLLDAVLYTHHHCDHIMGMDDLRTFWYRSNKTPISVYATETTLKDISKRFDYAFEQFDESYPATVKGHVLPHDVLTIGKIDIVPVSQIHGSIETMGFRIGDFAYSTDLNMMTPESLDKLKGIKTWVVGAFHNDEGCHNHAGFDQIKEWVNYLKPEMTYLTHLTAQADYDDLCRKLPANIRPAYDGLEIMQDYNK